VNLAQEKTARAKRDRSDDEAESDLSHESSDSYADQSYVHAVKKGAKREKSGPDSSDVQKGAKREKAGSDVSSDSSDDTSDSSDYQTDESSHKKSSIKKKQKKRQEKENDS